MASSSANTFNWKPEDINAPKCSYSLSSLSSKFYFIGFGNVANYHFQVNCLRVCKLVNSNGSFWGSDQPVGESIKNENA